MDLNFGVTSIGTWCIKSFCELLHSYFVATATTYGINNKMANVQDAMWQF